MDDYEHRTVQRLRRPLAEDFPKLNDRFEKCVLCPMVVDTNKSEPIPELGGYVCEGCLDGP